jgi:hypothetical protein
MYDSFESGEKKMLNESLIHRDDKNKAKHVSNPTTILGKG